jgi:hypothetical protein
VCILGLGCIILRGGHDSKSFPRPVATGARSQGGNRALISQFTRQIWIGAVYCAWWWPDCIYRVR